MPQEREYVLCWQTSVLPRGPLLASDYKALLLAVKAGPSHLWPECIRWPATDGDASKADIESEVRVAFSRVVQSPQSPNMPPSLLPLSTPAPNEPELTALMQPVCGTQKIATLQRRCA